MRLFPENLPPEMKESPSWTMWKKGIRDGKPAKVPYQPNGQEAKSNDPSTWTSLDAVLFEYQDVGGFDGICWMMPTEPGDVVFIDIDHCIRDGIIELWAQKVIDEFDSYTERSQSEHGLHILIKGKKPGKRCRKHGQPYEIYDHLRPCYLTGDVVGAHTTIEARQEPLDRLYNELFPEANEPQQKSRPGKSSLSDKALILKATLAKNGNAFKLLWDGSTLGHGGDESAADLALVNMLAFWSDGDAEQMDHLFRQSKLMRPKWDEKRGAETYGQLTINKAISDAREFYKPGNEHPPFGCPGHKPEEWFDGCWYGKPKTPEQMFVKGMSQEDLEKHRLQTGPKFSINLPADHFLTRFIGYGTAISDAYMVYWFMVGMFILSVIADKKLKFVTKMDTYYPNIWIYILGDSSLARKSTAVKKAAKMLEVVIGPNFLRACVPNTFSPEAFIEHMAEHPHGPWIRDEAAGVLSIMQKDYMRGFKDDLMQMFDCQRITRMLRTKKGAEKSRFDVDDPYLSLLFASTMAALGYSLELIDKETGFLARFMFSYPQEEKETYMPLDIGSPVHSELEEICVSQLTTIKATIDAIPECLTMIHEPGARQFYNAWQEQREKEASKLRDGYTSQIFSRLNPNVMKMAMFFEMGSSDFDPARPIRELYFREACRLVDDYFMPTTRAVYDGIGTANKENNIDRIILYLTRHGGAATKKEIN